MNSWHVQQLKYAFGIGSFMSFYGIVGLIVYMLPAETASVNQKIVIVACVLLTMPFALLVGYVASKRKARKEKKKAEKEKEDKEGKDGEAKADEKAADGEKPQKVAPAPANDDLNKSAEETVQFLKNSNLAGGSNGKDAVYSLPWYLVAGTPKSGKTSLVLGSNLNFQNLPSQRQSEQKFVRPTRNIDWRVTSDAVFVDTAGRYQTEGVDADEWSSLIDTIKKYRPNRPLDGLLLTVSAEKILNSDEAEIEQLAKVLRARLDEAMTRIKVRFPVYLIFTHADAIEGFKDSFSLSKQEGKMLVWGSTIPLEKSENAQTLFDGEYELLHNSVMKRRLMRLSAPFPPVRQLRIFNFPLHFGAARRKIGAFVSTLFRPNPFSESPFLRGFYFTAVPTNKAKTNGGAGAQTMPGTPQTIGQTFFTEKFFRDVVLRDKDLVKTFQEQRQKPPILGWLLTILGTFLVLGLLIWAGVSLYNNRALVTDASKKGEAVLGIVRNDRDLNPLDKKPADVEREIMAIDDLRKVLVKLDDYERNGAPLYLGLGLYSGDRIYKEKLLRLYFNAVERRFKNPTKDKLEADLKQFANSNPVANPAQLTEAEEKNLGKYYDLLKAYLMLSGEYREKANPTDISDALKEYWVKESKIPSGLEPMAHEQLEFWAKQVDREEPATAKFPRIALDAGLVKSVRTKLVAFPARFRYYKRKVTEISKEIDDKHGAMTVEGILSRNNGDANFMEGTYTIPGAYTIEGYRLMKKAISEADKELSADDWVMGELDKKEAAATTDAGIIQDRYFRDYTDHWHNFIKGARVKPYTKENAKAALESFSSKSSPMQILAKEIARNTDFSGKPKALGWWEWITEGISGLFSKKESTDTGGTSPVEREFRPLFTFVDEGADKKGAPVDKYQGEIEKVSNKFGKFSAGEVNQLAQDLAKDDDKKFPELRSADQNVNNLLKAFNETSAAQTLADLLKQPIGNLRSLFGADAQTQLTKTWAEKILPEAKEIEKGFPFEDSPTEADINKLKAFLNPVDGTLSKFYNENLKNDIEESGGQYKIKDTAKIKNYSPEFLAYLTNAFKLRDMLFGKNASPAYAYTFEIKPITDLLIEGNVDGQEVKSGETKNLKFPADAGKEIGVNLKLASTAGTTTTTTTPTSANTSTSSVNSSNPTNSATTTQNNSSNTDSSDLSITKQSTWGLFRFINDGSPTPQSGAYLVTYKRGGKTVSVVVTPSGGDLFAPNVFKSVRAPQTMFK